VKFLHAAVVGALLGACGGPAAVPEPLPRPAAPETPAPVPGGAAIVRRSAGPVSVSRPGAPDGFALSAFRPVQEAAAGWGVDVGAAGRAEIAWVGREAALVLSGRSRVLLEDPDARGVLARLLAVTSSSIELQSGERLVLPGGAELSNEAQDPAGPFRLLGLDDGLVRVENVAGGIGRIRYRGVELDLAPLESVDLAAGLDAGAAGPDGEASAWSLGGSPIRILGGARGEPTPGGLRVVADGASTVEGLGVRIRMEAGDELVLRPSTSVTPAPAEAGTASPQ
jgi:hypothetical protein